MQLRSDQFPYCIYRCCVVLCGFPGFRSHLWFSAARTRLANVVGLVAGLDTAELARLQHERHRLCQANSCIRSPNLSILIISAKCTNRNLMNSLIRIAAKLARVSSLVVPSVLIGQIVCIGTCIYQTCYCLPICPLQPVPSAIHNSIMAVHTSSCCP